MPQHSGLPWYAAPGLGNEHWQVRFTDEEGGGVVLEMDRREDEDQPYRERTEADAKFIALAVNSHDELLAACKSVLTLCGEEFLDPDEISDDWKIVEAELRAAIAKAQA